MKIQSMLHNDRDDLLQFAYNQLSKNQRRDDYKEYLESAIIFLGGTVPTRSHALRSLNGKNNLLLENMDVP